MTRAALVAFVALLLAGLVSAAGLATGRSAVAIRGCDDLYYERDGSPQRLIVSNLPMEDSAHTAMHQMTQAIKLELKGRGFRAGRFTVGYLSCDDSGPAGASSRARCVTNARSAAKLARVVAVIGTLDSACARAKLPVLASAKLLLLTPLNTADDLTLGRGQVARLSATDSDQAAAAARFLRGTGARRIAVLSDGTPRGNVYANAFRRVAASFGLRAVRTRADAAYVGGLLAGPTRKTLASARRLAGDGAVALSAGYGPVEQLVDTAAPGEAEGAYLFVAGVPDEKLGAPGEEFVRHYESSIGTTPHPYAVYAAQSAVLLLNAIARTNGSRTAVAKAVRAARVRNGLIGSFAFDRHGDAKPAAVTIFRVHGRRADIVRVVDSGIP